MSDPDSTLVDHLRLVLTSGIGPRLYKLLVDRFGSPSGVLAAAPSQWCEVPGIGAKLARALAVARESSAAVEQLQYCREHQIELLTPESDGYPAALREIVDPPGVLFVRGQLQPSDALAVAIVGSRHATRYGITQAERLAGSLARAGLTVISGLARGIDGAAHRGALAAGGRTIAVLGSGVANIYPPEHVDLALEIIAHGALLSETPPTSPPLSGAFPQRNRIITGLSLGVIVVEAATHSGALISARHAMEQGREVFAVPGPIDSRLSRGCHRLIRDGAKLVESADDVLEELGHLVAAAPSRDGQTVHHPAELLLNDQEQRVLAAVGSSATDVDAIVAGSGLSGQQVLATLTVLEMRRLVRRVSGFAFLRP